MDEPDAEDAAHEQQEVDEEEEAHDDEHPGDGCEDDEEEEHERAAAPWREEQGAMAEAPYSDDDADDPYEEDEVKEVITTWSKDKHGNYKAHQRCRTPQAIPKDEREVVAVPKSTQEHRKGDTKSTEPGTIHVFSWFDLF